MGSALYIYLLSKGVCLFLFKAVVLKGIFLISPPINDCKRRNPASVDVYRFQTMAMFARSLHLFTVFACANGFGGGVVNQRD